MPLVLDRSRALNHREYSLSSDRVVQIGLCKVRRRHIQPVRDSVDELLLRLLARDRGTEDLPVVLGVRVASVQRHTILLKDFWVELRFHGIDRLRNKIETKLAITKEVVQKAVGVVHPVSQRGVWLRKVRACLRDGVLHPEAGVVVSNLREVLAIVDVTGAVGDLRHSFDADDTLDGEIGLIGKSASEVICGDLVHRNQGVVNEVVVPLLQNVVVLSKICVVVCTLSVGQSHDQHVTTFFEGLLLVLPIVVTSRVREGTSYVVDRELVGPVACFLVDEEWIKQIFQDSGICVDGNRVEWKDDVHGVDIAIWK